MEQTINTVMGTVLFILLILLLIAALTLIVMVITMKIYHIATNKRRLDISIDDNVKVRLVTGNVATGIVRNHKGLFRKYFLIEYTPVGMGMLFIKSMANWFPERDILCVDDEITDDNDGSESYETNNSYTD